MQKIDMTGKTFGRLTVLREGDKSNAGKIKWVCLCSCGNEASVHGGALRSGGTQSCGCHRREASVANNTTHSMSKSDVYAIWIGMRDRCTNEKNHAYADYGGRGIKVCARWMNSFEAFIGDMGSRPSRLHSIYRRDNDGNYEPGNCHWATKKVQSRNKRGTIRLLVGEETKSLADLAEENGLKYERVYQRKLRGASDEEALSQHHGKRRYLTLGSVTRSMAEWSAITGLKKTTIQMRLRSGWAVEKALTQGARKYGT